MTTEDDEVIAGASLPELLQSLTGQGIYDIAFVENELPRFGFQYSRRSDLLWWSTKSTKLGARPPEIAAGEDNDSAVDPTRSSTGLVFDAIQLSTAILRLISNSSAPTGASYNRARQYKTDVALITTLWRS
jgi:hypothetical protein